jgi:NAD(P)-dependent dehydrogenase (short-subunit alcohol dehydrogenase family)
MRRALITGGCRGIGLACARRLADDGLEVIVSGRDEAAVERTTAAIPGARGAVLDVTDAEAWSRFDPDVDVLVANAGIADAAPVHRLPIEQFRYMLDVNITGALLSIRAVLPGMRTRGWGRIIAIGSTSSHHGVLYGSAYAASKHGLLGLMRSVAMEVIGTAITANTVCPAVVHTDMTDDSIARLTGLGRTEDAAKAELINALVPLGRFITVEEVADAVAYFAGERAAAVNGQSLILDGGGIQQ